MEQTGPIQSLSLSQLGRVLQRRFRIDEPIGAGSMGMVFRAWDLAREQLCAVKLLHASSSRNDAVVIRFCDEARIISRLCHPNIVEMYECGEEPDGTLFLAMELLRGQDLHTLLATESRLPLASALEIVRQVGSALNTVHLSGVVHRDIKPRNIFLTPHSGDPTLRHAKLIDFGLSKSLDTESRRSDGMIIGTPDYLPPEAWRGVSSDVDARSDQWALAVVAYRMLGGRLPFDGGSDTVMLAHEIRNSTPRPLRELVQEIPEHIDLAIQRALAKDKAQRFRTVLDFIRALNQLPMPAVLPSRPEPTTRPPAEPLLASPLPGTAITPLGEPPQPGGTGLLSTRLAPLPGRAAGSIPTVQLRPDATPTRMHMTPQPLSALGTSGDQMTAFLPLLPESQSLRRATLRLLRSRWLPLALTIFVLCLSQWSQNRLGGRSTLRLPATDALALPVRSAASELDTLSAPLPSWLSASPERCTSSGAAPATIHLANPLPSALKGSSGRSSTHAANLTEPEVSARPNRPRSAPYPRRQDTKTLGLRVRSVSVDGKNSGAPGEALVRVVSGSGAASKGFPSGPQTARMAN